MAPRRDIEKHCVHESCSPNGRARARVDELASGRTVADCHHHRRTGSSLSTKSYERNRFSAPSLSLARSTHRMLAATDPQIARGRERLAVRKQEMGGSDDSGAVFRFVRLSRFLCVCMCVCVMIRVCGHLSASAPSFSGVSPDHNS